MTQKQLLSRVLVDSRICAGRPHIRGTRIHIAIILDALVSGLTPTEIVEHYPDLDLSDVRAAVAYATKLAQENGGLAMVNRVPVRRLQPR
jgi:uncharacterized protein (DUF433 family)